MSGLLLRVLKRKTSLELDTGDEFFEAEFRTKEGLPDLDLSVFDIMDVHDHVLRTHAEYNASFLTPPPPHHCRGIDLQGCSGFDIAETPGTTRFRFTQERHRSLCFLHEKDLLTVARISHMEQQKRGRHSAREKVQGYINERLTSNDSEWEALCAERPKWSDWAQRARKEA